MEDFLKTPYLPENMLTEAIAGDGAKPFEQVFASLGIKLHYIQPMKQLSFPMNTHADCALCPLTSRTFYLECGQTALGAYLSKLGATVYYKAEHLLNGYPEEAALNVLPFGRTLVCNKKTVDSSLLRLAISQKYAIINCKQGYTKCSVAPVSHDALITDDVGIFKVLCREFDVLLLKKGDVKLQNFPYGFIGGACMMISKTDMLFFGDAKTHVDFEHIKSFLRNHNVYLQSAARGSLQDIGSVIPLLERREVK